MIVNVSNKIEKKDVKPIGELTNNELTQVPMFETPIVNFNYSKDKNKKQEI